MARLITKFKYLKPDERNHFGGYAEYIATREGVEKIDESKRNAPATNKQKQLIKKILSDFPNSKSSLEYEDYLKEKTVGAASEFITRMLEENADEMMHTTTYADYIATRPRAERFGSHGLFTDDGVAGQTNGGYSWVSAGSQRAFVPVTEAYLSIGCRYRIRVARHPLGAEIRLPSIHFPCER